MGHQRAAYAVITGPGHATTIQDVDDYFAVINATNFTLVAKGWKTDPSSPACNPEVYVNFAPDGNGEFPVTQRGFQDGSFRLAVGPSQPPEPTWDMYFSGSGVCDYTVTLGEFTIEC